MTKKIKRNSKNPSINISVALQLAIKHHQRGELQQAEALYHQVLLMDKNNADALHLLGVIALRAGKNKEATAHYNLGTALQEQGKLDEAIVSYRHALRLNPEFPEAHNNLGGALHGQGKLDEAIDSYHRALSLNADYPEAHNNLGNAFKDQGKLDEAIDSYHRALSLNANYPEAHYNLGNAFKEQGKLDEAIARYHHALSLKPDYPAAHNNLGNAFRDQGKLEEAIACYHRALSLKPNYPGAHTNLGNAFKDQGKLEEAIACYHRALSLKPDYPAAHNNLGNAFRDQGNLEEAIACYHRALSLKPNYPAAHTNLGNALKEQGKLEEAVACYRRALSLTPEFPEAYTNLGNVFQNQGRLKEAMACYQKALELKHGDGIRIKLAALMPIIMPSKESVVHLRQHFEQAIDGFLEAGVSLGNPFKDIGQTNFYLAYHGLNNRELQVKIAKLYTNACPSLLYAAPHCKKEGSVEKTLKMKIGFISSYFCDHTIGKHFRGVISNLSREQFNVHVFFAKKKSDQLSRYIEGNADKSVTLVPSLETARKQIAECELDMLFYTDIGMDPLTYFLAFSRLAPVQCVTWGHPDTTGIPNIDYYISCEDFETEGSETQYSECLVRMKNVPNYFYRPEAVELTSARNFRKRLGLPEAARLYVVPQSLFKLHPDFDAVLGEILRLDGNGLLVLFEETQKALRTLLMDRFRLSIPDVAERIIFLPRLSFNDFLSFMRSADAVLDTPYFCGGTTSLEIFSVGCPIVTWPGSRMASRFTYAYYKKMNVMDLVCNDSDQYIQRALRLAHDADWKKQISEKILERNNIFYNNLDSVRELEQFFLCVTTISK